MKSIVEEGSSIFNAIEKAWARAGKPQEFTVKVFEQAEKNFFGLTSKPAKIAIFFDEKVVAPASIRPPKKPTHPEVPKKQPRPGVAEQKPRFAKKEPPKERPRISPWTNEMADTAQAWIKKCLVLLGLPNIAFTTTIIGNNLKVQFNTPVVGDKIKERFLFSSFAHLILETLRNQFKKPFRTLKVILNSD